MNLKRWIPLVLAVVLGVVAAKLSRDALMRGRSNASNDNLIATVTASRDMAPGDKFAAGDLTTVRVPAESVPAQTFQAPAEVVDRVAATRIVKGQTVLEGLLAPKGMAGGVQALVPPGMRAITLQVNEFTGVAGLLLPGCRVDVVSVIKGDGETGPTSRTVVQNVEVWAVGREISSAAAAANATPAEPGAPAKPATNNVTLLMTPQQVEAVQVASVNGNPWLALRNAKDAEAVSSDGTTFADLRGTRTSKPEDLQPATETKLVNDPFADAPGASTSVTTGSNKTRTVTFIRNTKVEDLTVELPEVPATPAPETEKRPVREAEVTDTTGESQEISE
jgi:pilus assembly protein CpaB